MTMTITTFDTALEKAFEDYLELLFNTLREEEPVLYRKMKNMILNGEANEVRDFIWENLTKDERPAYLADLLMMNEADDWNRRAKAGEIMRIT
tara:strand:+ start:907 stop:1185 length:279 start_codon:yes stop_codon:yes gene_type:complete